VRRIDPVGFVATQLGAGEVPNLCGVDNADDVAPLMQCARDAEAKAPGGFQTGVNSLDLLGDQPIKQMAPSMTGINEAPRAYLVATRHAYVERIFGNVDTQYPVVSTGPDRVRQAASSKPLTDYSRPPNERRADTPDSKP
jgi:hypothetical protein